MGTEDYTDTSFVCPYPSPPLERANRRVQEVMVRSSSPTPPLTASRGSFGTEESSSMSSSPLQASPVEPATPPSNLALFGASGQSVYAQFEKKQQASSKASAAYSELQKKQRPAPISTGLSPQHADNRSLPRDIGSDRTQDGRRESVYLPLGSDPPSALWKTFGSPRLSPDSSMLPLPPKSPSAIHPSYGQNYSPMVASFGPDDSPRLGTRSTTLHATKRSDPLRPFFLDSSGRLLSHSRIQRTMDSPAAWLFLYFLANLGLTLYNKFVLVRFPFPWSLTAVHTLCGSIGARTALHKGLFVPARLTKRESLVLLGFSGLYTINIAVSNLSLHLVTVPFHQVVRAMTPLFTIGISVLFLHKHYSRNVYFSLGPIIAGVAFATYGDYYFTWWGLVLTLFGTLLAALKTVMTNFIQVGRLKLHPLDLLLRMSPLAFIQCVIASWYTGEMERVREHGAMQMTHGAAIALLINGVLAFLLNVVSFSANKKTSPLTMTVAANVKQVLTILLAVLLFNLKVSGTNLVGIVLTLGGGMLYAGIEYQERRRRAYRLETTSPLASVSVSAVPR